MHQELTTYLFLPRCVSTQKYLRQSGLPPWSIVQAQIQTAGQGRKGRRWESPVGGLYYSFRYPAKVSSTPATLQIMGGALCWLEILEEELGVFEDFSLKWPNDLLCRGRKIGGMLAEQRSGAVDAGFGINVNNKFNDLSGYRRTPISLSEVSNRKHNLENLLANWLKKFIPALRKQSSMFFSRRRIQDKLMTVGREIEVRGKRGKAIGIGSQGELILEVEGEAEQIFAGDVEEVQHL